MDRSIALVVLLIVVICIGAFASVDWGALLGAGSQSHIIVEPSPSKIPEHQSSDVPEHTPSEVPELEGILKLELNISSIDWGVISPGGFSEVPLLIKNVGNVDVDLSVRAANMTPPEAEKYLTLSWDLSAALAPGESHEVVLRLTVSPEIIGIEKFSFDIIITVAQI